MSTEEYQHKFAVVSSPENADPKKADFEHIERIVRESGFGGRYLVQFSKLPGYIGLVLETDRMPTKKEFKKLDMLGLKEISY